MGQRGYIVTPLGVQMALVPGLVYRFSAEWKLMRFGEYDPGSDYGAEPGDYLVYVVTPETPGNPAWGPCIIEQALEEAQSVDPQSVEICGLQWGRRTCYAPVGKGGERCAECRQKLERIGPIVLVYQSWKGDGHSHAIRVGQDLDKATTFCGAYTSGWGIVFAEAPRKPSLPSCPDCVTALERSIGNDQPSTSPQVVMKGPDCYLVYRPNPDLSKPLVHLKMQGHVGTLCGMNEGFWNIAPGTIGSPTCPACIEKRIAEHV